MIQESTDESIERVLQKHDRDRAALIPILQEVQEIDGYLSGDAVRRVADYLSLSANEVYGVATFYSYFRFNPPGRHRIKLCQGTACHVRGSGRLLDTVKRRLGIEPEQTTEDRAYSLECVMCLGCCALAPTVVLDEKTHANMTPKKIETLLDGMSE
jgi:NADH-quinone oxidoreductase subunit E